MKINNYIKFLSAMLIVFGSTTVQSGEISQQQAAQDIHNELQRINDLRNMNKMNFNKLYDRMKTANEYKKKL